MAKNDPKKAKKLDKTSMKRSKGGARGVTYGTDQVGGTATLYTIDHQGGVETQLLQK